MGSGGSNREGGDCGHNRETLIFTKSAGSEVLRLTGHLGNLGLVDLLGREGNGTPLQYSCLENPMDGRAW